MTLKSILNVGLLISLVLAMLMGFAHSTVNLANDLTNLSSFVEAEENKAPFQSSLAEPHLVVTGEYAHQL